jgi:putative transposase
LIAY